MPTSPSEKVISGEAASLVAWGDKAERHALGHI